MTTDKKKEIIGKKELSRRLGKACSTIDRWRKLGMPELTKPSRKAQCMFDWLEVCDWLDFDPQF